MKVNNKIILLRGNSPQLTKDNISKLPKTLIRNSCVVRDYMYSINMLCDRITSDPTEHRILQNKILKAMSDKERFDLLKDIVVRASVWQGAVVVITNIPFSIKNLYNLYNPPDIIIINLIDPLDLMWRWKSFIDKLLLNGTRVSTMKIDWKTLLTGMEFDDGKSVLIKLKGSFYLTGN